MTDRTFDRATLAAVGLLSLFGVFLNPLLAYEESSDIAYFWIFGIAAALAFGREFARNFDACRRIESVLPRPTWWAWIGLGWIVLLWFGLYLEWFRAPRLFADDFRYLLDARKAENVFAYALAPFNEHMVVATRLLMLPVGGIEGNAASAAVLAGIGAILFIVNATLLFLLARNFGGGDLGGLVAAAAFALSLSHQEIVVWCSASQWLVPSGLLLAALWSVEVRPHHWATPIALAVVGPWCYMLGAAVGPIAAMWHWLRHRDSLRLPAAIALAGVASAVVAVAIVSSTMRRQEYWASGGRGMVKAFDPIGGFAYIERLTVDRLVLTNFGYRNLPTSVNFALATIAALTVAGVASLRRRPQLAVVLPTVMFWAVGYGMTIPFRTWENYYVIFGWSRYQLLPQLGLAVAIALALPAVAPSRCGPATGRGVAAFAVLSLFWMALQKFGWPR